MQTPCVWTTLTIYSQNLIITKNYISPQPHTCVNYIQALCSNMPPTQIISTTHHMCKCTIVHWNVSNDYPTLCRANCVLHVCVRGLDIWWQWCCHFDYGIPPPQGLCPRGLNTCVVIFSKLPHPWANSDWLLKLYMDHINYCKSPIRRARPNTKAPPIYDPKIHILLQYFHKIVHGSQCTHQY